MHITWYGHAAFGIQTRNREGEPRRIVLDPYNYPDCGGYLPIDVEADVVSISHENRKYHSDLSAIRGKFHLIDGLELASRGRPENFEGIRFEAIQVHENDRGEGPNAMVKMTAEGLTIAHQGDLGHALDEAQLEFLEGIDILLALTGGSPTLNLEDQLEIIERVRPSLVLPMHYRTPKVNLDLLPLEAFLDLVSDTPIIQEGDYTAEIERDFLPEATTILVLEHSR